MGLFSYSKIPDYENHKAYEGYEETPIRTKWTMINASANAPIVLNQIQDCSRICSTTYKPLTFFYRYDMLIKRSIELAYIAKYVRVHGANPVKLANQTIQEKQEHVKELINHAFDHYFSKIPTLKTDKSKLRTANKFYDDFRPFFDEMSAENIQHLETEHRNLVMIAGGA